jgi:hypothetical protein
MVTRRLILLLSAASLLSAQPVTRVLFIGNSYTYYNNLPEIFTKLAEAGGQRVETLMVAPGGWTLKHHWDTDTRKSLESGKWDYVVLQEQSTLGAAIYVDGRPRVDSNGDFESAAESWIRAIEHAGAKPVLYLTWARQDTPEDQAALNHYYFEAAAERHTMVAPVGLAWGRVRQESSIPLFQPDGSHPLPAGSYLAACTLYATIFDRNPNGLPVKITGIPVDLKTEKAEPDKSATLVDLPENEAKVLQTAAWKAVGESRAPDAAWDLPERTPPPMAEQADPPPEEKKFAGDWMGKIYFFPSGPSDMTLYLMPMGNGWRVHFTLKHHTKGVPDESLDLIETIVRDGNLMFTDPKCLALNKSPVHFSAYLSASGELWGYAEAQVERPGASNAKLSGHFKLTRAK